MMLAESMQEGRFRSIQVAPVKPIVVVFGTFDLDGGRARTVCDAMRCLGWRLETCHRRFWSGTAAKLGVFRAGAMLRTVGRAAVMYPFLVFRALLHVPFDFMLICPGGFLDICFGWIAARLTGATIIFDPLYGLWETIVEDRQLLSARSAPAKAVGLFERLCFRLADVVLVDTEDHVAYFLRQAGLSRRRIIVVPVGAEDGLFYPRESDSHRRDSDGTNVLFYGSMIRLHGADTIIRAAHKIGDPQIRFTLVGRGQMSEQVESLARQLACRNVTFVPRVPYETVPALIRNADICLGIFGTTQKARDVVPTKVYQCLAMGKPVVTGDTPATRRLFESGKHLLTVPCGDADALAEAIVRLKNDSSLRESLGRAAKNLYSERFSAAALAQRLKPLEARIR